MCIYCLFTGFPNITSDNTSNFNIPFCDIKERQPKVINTLMLGIIGQTALSFIIYMIYYYTLVLENRQVNISTVKQTKRIYLVTKVFSCDVLCLTYK